MSDIRFNRWLHQSGTGGVSQDSSGRVGIGSSVPRTALDVVGVVSATSFSGSLTGNVTGNLTGNVTGNISGTINTSGLSTFSGGINVGNTFLRENSIGIGSTSTSGRNAGINTAEGTIIYNSTAKEVQVYKGSIGWTNVGAGFIEATGGVIGDYTSNNIVYRAHVFTSSGTFGVTNAPSGSSVEYLVVGGGGGSASHGAGGGGGGFITGTGIPVSSSGSFRNLS